jgi:hypothetical protein
MGRDHPGTVGGAGGSRIHDQAVCDALMDAGCLQASHAANPIKPATFPHDGYLRVAPR